MIEVGPEDRVFVLTGAGISAESGISTFRDSDGLWNGIRFEEVATPEAWRRNPKQVWEFYSMRRKAAADKKPNPAHVALAQLEAALGDRLLICTQNVDDLHEQAGSTRVLHMHGNLFQSRCGSCGRPPFDDRKTYEEELPKCLACGGAGTSPYLLVRRGPLPPRPDLSRTGVLHHFCGNWDLRGSPSGGRFRRPGEAQRLCADMLLRGAGRAGEPHPFPAGGPRQCRGDSARAVSVFGRKKPQLTQPFLRHTIP